MRLFAIQNCCKDLVDDPASDAILLNYVTCRPNLAFDHLFHQLLVWFVYIHHSSLFFQQPSELLREHILLKVKARRR